MRSAVVPCMLLLVSVVSVDRVWSAESLTLGENFEVAHVAEDVIEERSVSSRRHCAFLCQTSASGECSAASYDASSGLCQLLTMNATRLTPLPGRTALFRRRDQDAIAQGQVAMWPLNDLYQGKNLAPGKTPLSLQDVTFPDGGAQWLSAPAYFSGATTSYAQVNEIADVKFIDSFAFIAAVYRQDSTVGPLIEWDTGTPGSLAVLIWVWENNFFVHMGCGDGQHYGVPLNNDQWYTLALSYDHSTRTLSMWMDGVLKEIPNACSSSPAFSTTVGAFLNHRPNQPSYKMKGHITCMGLYNKPMTYDEMVASTTPHCQPQ